MFFLRKPGFLLLYRVLFEVIKEQLERLSGCFGYILITSVILRKLKGHHIIGRTTCQPNCANRNFLGSSTRTGITGCRNGLVGSQHLTGTFHPCNGHFLTDGSLLCQHLRINP